MGVRVAWGDGSEGLAGGLLSAPLVLVSPLGVEGGEYPVWDGGAGAHPGGGQLLTHPQARPCLAGGWGSWLVLDLGGVGGAVGRLGACSVLSVSLLSLRVGLLFPFFLFPFLSILLDPFLRSLFPLLFSSPISLFPLLLPLPSFPPSSLVSFPVFFPFLSFFLDILPCSCSFLPMASRCWF